MSWLWKNAHALSQQGRAPVQTSREAQSEYAQYRKTVGRDGFRLESGWRRERVTPILATKLYLPRLRPNVVSRPRLIKRLNEGLYRKLTLISAPAGFGKTTLVSQWIEGIKQATAWLSLDEGENDPTRFLTYFIAAVQTIAPTVGEGPLRALQSPQPPSTEVILTALLNDLTTIKDPFVLVLDDYHLIEA